MLDTFKFATDWVSKIFNKLVEIRQQRELELDKIGDVFGDSLELVKYYVEPDCQQFNPADDDEDEISYVVREPIFRRIEAFFSGAIREGKNQLFILSDAGMGKTSFLVMLKLAHLTSFWPKEYDCLLYKIVPDTLVELQKVTGRRNKILLLDALDEDSSAWGRVEERITEILDETRNFRRVIITCRTQFFSAGEDPFNRRGQVEIGGFLCPVIYNSLFSDEQMSEYLRRKFGRGKTATLRISQGKLIIQKMGSLKFRPMLLSHIEDFLEAGQENWNEYSIYETLIRVWFLREQRKHLDREEPIPPADRLWLACQTLAFHLQKQGRREISEDELSTLITQHPILQHIPKIDITGRSLLNKNSSGHYRFSHYSIQEFLIVNGSLHGSLSLKESEMEPTDQMMSFLVAWLTDPNRTQKLPVDISVYGFNGADLRGVRLSGEDIRNLNFKNADLRNSDLTSAKIQWAKLEGADLRGANLRNAILHWANFQGAKFNSSTLWPRGGRPEGSIFIDE